MVYGKISGPDSMSETVQIFVWSRLKSVRILYESKKYFFLFVQTKYRQVSVKPLDQTQSRFLSVFCLYEIKNIFSISTDSVQILIWTRSVQNLYGFAVRNSHIESGPDLNLYAICPPLVPNFGSRDWCNRIINYWKWKYRPECSTWMRNIFLSNGVGVIIKTNFVYVPQRDVRVHGS